MLFVSIGGGKKDNVLCWRFQHVDFAVSTCCVWGFNVLSFSTRQDEEMRYNFLLVFRIVSKRKAPGQATSQSLIRLFRAMGGRPFPSFPNPQLDSK
jgi:hypothetical protein